MSTETLSDPTPPEDALERGRLLGAIAQFPAPFAVYAGPDHVFVAASEQYRRIVRGRDLIGRPLREVLPELAEQGFVAMLDRAYATGEPVCGSDVPADWDDDGDGRVEAHFVDFTYQPVTDPDGRVWGIVAHLADVTGRHLSEVALRESEARFRSLFDSAGIGMALGDDKGRLVAVNGAMSRMLGYPPEVLLEKGAAGLSHPDDMALDLELYGELLEGRRPSYQIDKRYFRRDGSMLWGRLTVSLVRAEAGEVRYSVALLEDVTESRREAEERAFLAEASRVLASSLEYEPTLRAVARLAVPALADWCAIDLLEGGEFRRVAVEHPDPGRLADAVRIHERYPPDPAAPHGAWKVVRTGEPELLEEVPDALLEALAADPEHLRLLRALGLRSALVVPLAARGEVLGAMTLVHAGSGRRFGPRDLPAAVDLAGRAAAAIINARLFTETEEARGQLERQAIELEHQAEEMQVQGVELEEAQVELEAANDELRIANEELTAAAAAREEARRAAEDGRRRAAFLAEASRLLASSLDYAATLHNLAEAAVPGLGDWCAVDMLADPDSDAWPPDVRRLAVAHQDPEKVAWARELETRAPQDWNAPTGLPRVLREGVAEFYPEITDEMLVAAAKSEEELMLLREIGFSAYICVPLAARGRVLGALTLCTTESGRRYIEDDLALAEELARRAAVAVDGAHLFAAERAARADAERTAERMARLQRVTAALSGAVTPERVARVVVEEGAAALDAAAAVVARLHEERGELEIVHALGHPDDVVERFRRIPLSARLPLADAVRGGRPVYLATEDERRAVYPTLVEAYPRTVQQAWAALPLAVEGRVMGALALSFTAERAFDGDDRTFLELLAQQCAQALDRSRLYEAEHRARTEAEAASRAKSDFMAVMSHELRTPLNAVLGYLDLLDAGVAGPLTAEQGRYLARVTASGRHLLGLIEEVLTFSRIEADREEVAMETVRADEVARQAAELVEPLARARGLEFRVEVDGAAAELRTDPGKLRQVLVNLLGNAVKFTDAGEVALVATVPPGGPARFRVRDTGIGIPPGARERVFEPFWQAAQGNTRRAGGTGLGLAVARELARLLGGDLTLESEEGAGSVFTVEVPVDGRAGA
ncbi:MAG TPA: GAF domain-containing protein [Longimicrobiaceae bacterium]|nr:GAF domain-containing protein [Longimicrobiaceae bacterium]